MLLLLLKILCLPAGIALTALFAGSETAFTSLSETALAGLKEKYPSRRSLFEFWEKYPDRVLAGIVLGNTLGTVICGVLAASIARDCAKFVSFPEKWLVLVFSFLVTLAVVVFGEVMPKIAGRLHSEKWSARFARLIITFARVIRPILKILVRIANIFVRMVGAEPQSELPTLTIDELKGMLGQGIASTGEGKAPPHHILTNILEFGELKVHDVKKPIERVIGVDVRKSPKEVIDVVTHSGYSRVLAYHDTMDKVVGVIYAKDLLTAWRTAGLVLIPDLIRPAYFVTDDTPISQLLREFRKGRQHLAVVRDADKKITGIVTLENVLEELVGDVYDESQI